MVFSKLVKKKNIFVDLEANEREGALEEMIGRLKENGEISAGIVTALLEGLMSRERLGTTGIGKGIAIPHVRDDGLDDDPARDHLQPPLRHLFEAAGQAHRGRCTLAAAEGPPALGRERAPVVTADDAGSRPGHSRPHDVQRLPRHEDGDFITLLLIPHLAA